jgi:abhydrolase domain-containing protein 12
VLQLTTPTPASPLSNFIPPTITAFKTRNLYLHTADNETLGAWFTFADPFYASHKADLHSPSSSPDELIRSALRTHPTVLFLHGNGGTRALPSRVRHYQAFAARLHANVLAPDYRGYADSTGTPSESGLTLDARAAWDWLRAHGAPPESVLVVGNSLGTGVAVQLATALQADQPDGDEQRKTESTREMPRGVVLLAPFSNVETLLDTYYIAGLVPLLAPLRTFPFIASESLNRLFASPEMNESCLIDLFYRRARKALPRPSIRFALQGRGKFPSFLAVVPGVLI